MTYQTTMTSKGQVTIPAPIRRRLGLEPGQSIQFDFHRNQAIIKASSWQNDLARAQKKLHDHIKKHNIKPLSDEELDQAINDAGEQAALERYQRSLEP